VLGVQDALHDDMEARVEGVAGGQVDEPDVGRAGPVPFPQPAATDDFPEALLPRGRMSRVSCVPTLTKVRESVIGAASMARSGESVPRKACVQVRWSLSVLASSEAKGSVTCMGSVGYTTAEYGGVGVLVGPERGAYPYGNSLLVRGTAETLVVDPSLALVEDAPAADAVLVSHAHEDHVAGLASYEVPVHVHAGDLQALRSREVMLSGYGLAPDAAEAFGRELRDHFHVRGRPDAVGFADGTVFDLGGRRVTVVHLPGHTAGHSGFLIEPDGFLFLADIDLTSFGPYYGDLGSDLGDFEASMRRCREIDARWYGTFHQKGVIEGPAEFRRRLDAFAAVVATRDAALLTFLGEPRTLDEIAEHRLVYRPHVEAPYVSAVERRTAQQHLARLLREGLVVEVEEGRFRSV
jgi:glyoxylase-like metal-dependent hydrolase (beta-lactamase superfamily II)